MTHKYDRLDLFVFLVKICALIELLNLFLTQNTKKKLGYLIEPTNLILRTRAQVSVGKSLYLRKMVIGECNGII